MFLTAPAVKALPDDPKLEDSDEAKAADDRTGDLAAGRSRIGPVCAGPLDLGH
jgi:hypothetical protein